MDLIVWHLGALGDAILSVPALRAARRIAGRGARVRVLAPRDRAELFAACGAAHEALDGTRADLAPLFVAGGEPPPWLAERARGALVVLFFARAGAARRDAGPGSGGAAEPVAANLLRSGAARVIVAPPRPPADLPVHCADWLLRCVSPEARTPARPRLRVAPAVRAAGRAALVGAGLPPGTPYVAILPGSGGRRKRWPAERFLEVVRAAPGALGLAPLVVVGPVERDLDPGLAAAARASGAVVLDCPPLPLLAGALALAAACLGNDSGTTHLAAAVGAPTLALFGPASDPRVFAPRPRGPRAPVRVLAAGDLAGVEAARVLDHLAAVRTA